MIVTKFELPVFQPAEFLSIVPNFVLSISTGTETIGGECIPQNRDTQLTRPARKRGGREGPPQGRPNPWVGQPLVGHTQLHPTPERRFVSQIP